MQNYFYLLGRFILLFTLISLPNFIDILLRKIREIIKLQQNNFFLLINMYTATQFRNIPTAIKLF